MRGREDWTPRALVCSGLLTREADAVAEGSRRPAFELVSALESGDWAALRMAPADEHRRTCRSRSSTPASAA